MATNIISSIPKLKGRENYEDWAFAVENFLILEGMQDCIKKDGDVNDAKAKAKIILTIDPVLYVHIKQESSAKSLWTKLQCMFDDTGFSRKIGLLRNLISIRRENCDSMAQYVTLIVETSQRLNNTGFLIDDKWIGSLLLAGLPDKFSPMIMAIEHSGIEITADAIKSKLIDMDDGSEANQSHQGALISKGWQHKKYKKFTKDSGTSEMSNSKSNVKCYKCKKYGHYKNQCESILKNKQCNAFNAVFLSGKYSSSDWYIDSGASMHMTTNKQWLYNIRDQLEITEIVIADKSKISVECCGEVKITTVVNNTKFHIPVTDVLYVPSLATNLLSVSQLIKKGNKVSFEGNHCIIRNQMNEIVATADSVEGVYKLNITEVDCLLTSVSGNVWHRRFAHLNGSDLQKMKDGAVVGLTYTDEPKASKTSCIVCCEGKQARLPFSHIGNRSQKLLDLVHADICGPMETKSIGCSRYFLLLIDDYSRMAQVYFLKTKDEAFSCFKIYKSLVENQTGKTIKVLRTDNGLEFCSKEFEKYLQDAGIIHQKTNPYTPEQNGLCERLNRTVVEKSKCLLFDADLPKKFWAEAVNTAVYLRNRTVASGLNNKTPFELWFGRKPDVSHIRIFGSKIMVHIPKEKRLKWDKKAVNCILVGYSENVKGYRIYNPVKNTISTSRDIIVIEEGMNRSNVTINISNIDPEIKEEIKSEEDEEIVGNLETLNSDIILKENYDSDDSKENKDFTVLNPILDEETQDETRPRRMRKKPDWYGMTSISATMAQDNDYGEISLEEALNGPESMQWKRAIEDELKCFEENDAWELVDPPSDSSVVQCKWVLKKKYELNNQVRYRARLVAKGFSQRHGLDYAETFSPVVRHTTLRLLFALSVKYNFDTTHLDVTTAFLNGDLEETIYMQKPVCFNSLNDNKVLKLKKAIYGLKQSSRMWYQKVDQCLIKNGYVKSKLEPCLFYKMNDDTSKTIVALYVDDFFIFSNNSNETENLKVMLMSQFKIKDLGQIRQCLGMRVTYDKDVNVLTLDQEKYIDQLLCKFHMNDCKTADTPMESKLYLDRDENCDKSLPYQQLIGSLMYLAILTRPDIAFSVGYLSQFNNCYNKEHWNYAKHILRYLKKTKSYGLKYSSTGNLQLIGFVDADWGNNIIDRKSYTGFCFKLMGSLICWGSKKQKNVALSSTEAEFVGLSECSKEAVYLRNLQFEITNMLYSVLIYNDNQSAQKLVANPVFHNRSKHVDIRYHFCRDAVANKIVEVQYMPTAQMPADLFTKSLSSTKHYALLKSIGLEHC